jgi:hypothetical protein
MPDQKEKRSSPYCIRLSEDERARYECGAAGTSLASFIKLCVERYLGSPVSRHGFSLSATDREAFARLLGWLGQSRIASNLNQLAKAVNTGTLDLTPETEADLRNACRAIITMSEKLVEVLGRARGKT